MKKAHLFLIMSTLLVGCGKDINGTYTGTETSSNMSMAGQNQSSAVTITISGDDDNKTVSWVGQYGSGQGKLKLSGDESLSGDMSFTETFMGGMSPMSGQSGTTNTYRVNLTVSDKSLSGMGTSVGQSQPQQGQTWAPQMQGGSKNVTAKKAGD